MENKEILKKKIIYRAFHRGSKEMDILLGNFVKTHIDDLNYGELKDLENILVIEDDILQQWYFDQKNLNVIPKNKVSLLLKNFSFDGEIENVFPRLIHTPLLLVDIFKYKSIILFSTPSIKSSAEIL